MADGPSNTDSGTRENVAYKLFNALKYTVSPGNDDAVVQAHLDLYARCLRAASGLSHNKVI